MGRDQRETSIGNQEQDQRHENRHHDRQPRNVRQHKGRVILSDIARPGDQRSELGATVVAGVVITTPVKIERPDRRLFEFVETGRAHDSGD